MKHLFATVLIALSFQAFAEEISISSESKTGEFKEIPLSDPKYRRFALVGGITSPMDSQLAEALKTVAPGVEVQLYLNSMGGSVLVGENILQSLKALKEKGHVLKTVVINNDDCGSFCVPIFMAGTERLASDSSAFMFHGVRPWYSNIPNTFETQKWLQVLRDMGVDSAWLKKLEDLGVFRDPGEYYISGGSLFAEKSNIVTRLLDRHRKMKPESLPFDPQIRSR